MSDGPLTQFANVIQRLGVVLPSVTEGVNDLGKAIDANGTKAVTAPGLADVGDGKGGGLSSVFVVDKAAPELARVGAQLGAIFSRFVAVARKAEEQAGETADAFREAGDAAPILSNPNISPELRRILETADLPGLGDQPGLGNDYALKLIEAFIKNEQELRRADLSARSRQDRAGIRNELITFFGRNFMGQIESLARELERLRAESARNVTPRATAVSTRRTAGQGTGLRLGIFTGELR